MLDWTEQFERAAAQQGWCISEVGSRNSPCALELNHVEDAAAVSQQLGLTVPQLDNDAQAVTAFHAAWQAGQPHAVLAYQIVQHNSVSEFDHWHMQEWSQLTTL